jgi:hypothetical protein
MSRRNSKQKRRDMLVRSTLEEVVAIRKEFQQGNDDQAFRLIIAALFEREGLCQTLLTRIDELEKQLTPICSD